MGQNTILEKKTHEFFQMCDTENKGFIARREMQRLNGKLPLSAEELENVFDTLDSDSNGYLTLDEFSSGFSEFLFGQKVSVEGDMGDKTPSKSPPEVLYQTHWEESLGRGDEDEEEKHFCMLMESLGANSVFEDPAEVRGLWTQLRRDEPHLLSNFEDFLARVTSQIKEADQEKREMESALQRKAATHDDEIQHLYEEMEQQIKNEKDRIVLQDYERFLSLSQNLELQLSSKEKELEQLFQKQRRLEAQCQDLHSEQHVTKVENVKLKQTNDDLARELEQSSQELSLAQEQLTLLQEQSSRLHEEKEMEIYRLTEGLQRERAGLLKQLDLLREMNKHLRDERDMCYQEEGGPSPPDRLFKIVLVGNSSVGKTSLLRRFCDDSFHPGTSATVGIDYSVKTITVDSSQVALQLWDTAGQERYRSITKQFFRKADGVVVMYDITDKQSFTAVRQWLTSVKEGAGEDIPIMLLGNKTDKEIERQVQKGVGERLAKDCQMTLYECSACSGQNVLESMVHLARILKEQEDREKEKTVQLLSSPSEKKKSCC
ncbi:putative EF-hand calcium-binding domain-containing protein 4B-like [Scophthalmus maximus]|uniref:Putative EF-hand calcium-binding domain-containing protein 4B-like n=1 Tax=Scophthalmus maximus TaxID=52904 RepID=A0A2U9C0J7_SCOMX|nr:putative EF-hand calcium-binding domain-containing protein 4B-like [Scophthalmus maximus]